MDYMDYMDYNISYYAIGYLGQLKRACKRGRAASRQAKEMI